MTIYPAPKPAPREKAPKPKKPRTPLKRGSSARLSRSGPVKSINVEATKKRVKARKASRNDPEWRAENEAVMRAAWERAAGICECGCQRPMDVEGEPKWPGYPEFHHENYKKGRIRGRYLRRECHQRIEAIQFAHRNARRMVA